MGAGCEAGQHNPFPIMSILVLVQDLSRMELGILRHALANASDIDVVSRAEELARAPDVIVTSIAETGGEQAVDAILGRWPTSRVIPLSKRGAQASLVELRPCWTDLGELSQAGLADLIRSAAARPRIGMR